MHSPLLLVAGLISSAALSGPARAGALFVPGDYATIQQAIDASLPYDVIHVAAGTWIGPLVTLDHAIEILGEGADVTIVDAAGAPQVVLAGLDGASSIVYLENCTLTGGADGVLTAGGGSIWLTNCTIRDNTGVGARGHVKASSCTFAHNGSHGLDGFDSAWNCTFVGNGGWGAQALGAVVDNPQLELCSFLGNGLGGARLSVSGPSPAFPAQIHVLGCLFVGDNLQVAAVTSGGVGTSFVRSVTLQGGTVKLLQGALDVTDSILRSPTPITDLSATGDASVTWSDLPGAWLPGTGDIDADPLFTDPGAGDFTLLPGSPCINTGNPAVTDPDNSPADMGAFTYEPWTILGSGLGAGSSLLLWGQGPLIGGKPMGFALSPPAGTGVWLIASTTELGVPFKGGVLWPAVNAIYGPLFPLFTDSIASGLWPTGLPPGFTFVAQAWWPDPGAIQGWSASNGVRGVQP